MIDLLGVILKRIFSKVNHLKIFNIEYGEEHPYLCNSRFRHALHQLPPHHHTLLHVMASYLNSLCLDQSVESVSACGQTADSSALGISTHISYQSENSNLSDFSRQNLSMCQKLGEIFAALIFRSGPPTSSVGMSSPQMQTSRSEDLLQPVLLHKIFSQFISDYRAIFQIETTLEQENMD